MHAQGAFGGRSLALLQLHPVTIRHKQNPLRTREYGLVAEEVAKVFPEVVTRGPGGAVESVQYDELIPMLLNELQRMKAQNAALAARLARLEEAVPRSASLASR